MLRDDAQRTEHADLNELTRGVQPATGEHHVTKDLVGVRCDERKTMTRLDERAQAGYQIRHPPTVIAEGAHVHVPDGVMVRRHFRTDLHRGYGRRHIAAAIRSRRALDGAHPASVPAF